MKKHLFILFSLAAFNLTAAAGQASTYNDYFQSGSLYSFNDLYHSPLMHYKHGALYGYSPYFLSNQARSRYTYSAEEKGYYILGATDKAWPFCRLQDVGWETVPVKSTVEEAGILIALPAYDQLNKFKEESAELLTSRLQVHVEPRRDDSRELKDLIEKSKWQYESPLMEDKVEESPYKSRQDYN